MYINNKYCCSLGLFVQRHLPFMVSEIVPSYSLFFKQKNKMNINHLTPNDPYMVRTALLTSKCCILYVYSTNIGTEYFKHALYSPFFCSKCSLFHNANLFGSCIIHVLYTGCAKLKKNNSGAKGLNRVNSYLFLIFLLQSTKKALTSPKNRNFRRRPSSGFLLSNICIQYDEPAFTIGGSA